MKDFGYCKDCSHWFLYTQECLAIREVDIDEEITDSAFAISYEPDDNLTVSCRFRTGPDFGCSNFENKS